MLCSEISMIKQVPNLHRYFIWYDNQLILLNITQKILYKTSPKTIQSREWELLTLGWEFIYFSPLGLRCIRKILRDNSEMIDSSFRYQYTNYYFINSHAIHSTSFQSPPFPFSLIRLPPPRFLLTLHSTISQNLFYVTLSAPSTSKKII